MSPDYREELDRLLAAFLLGGADTDLRAHLVAGSRLPGPRANLELAAGFAEAVGARGTEARILWGLCTRWTDIPEGEAPVNDPREYVVFCGVRGIGALGAKSPSWAREALVVLRRTARDPRWRVREATAMAIQDIVEGQWGAVLRPLEGWVAPGAWLEMRAVAAGLAEPRILKEPRVANAALRAHRDILARVRKAKDRSSDDFDTLRQCLAYSASVVVAAAPDDGFRWLTELASTKDPDVQWIVRENLKKGRLIGPHHARVERIQAILRRA